MAAEPKAATEEAKIDLFEDDDEFEEFEINEGKRLFFFFYKIFLIRGEKRRDLHSRYLLHVNKFSVCFLKLIEKIYSLAPWSPLDDLCLGQNSCC